MISFPLTFASPVPRSAPRPATAADPSTPPAAQKSTPRTMEEICKSENYPERFARAGRIGGRIGLVLGGAAFGTLTALGGGAGLVTGTIGSMVVGGVVGTIGGGAFAGFLAGLVGSNMDGIGNGSYSLIGAGLGLVGGIALGGWLAATGGGVAVAVAGAAVGGAALCGAVGFLAARSRVSRQFQKDFDRKYVALSPYANASVVCVMNNDGQFIPREPASSG